MHFIVYLQEYTFVNFDAERSACGTGRSLCQSRTPHDVSKPDNTYNRVYTRQPLLYLSRCKIYAQFAPNAPKSKKQFWKHMLVLLCEEAHVEARFGLFRDSANLDAR
jgi:hypothetical protein